MRRLVLLAWPITVIAGIALCVVTLSIAQALRSHGIIVLVVSLLAVSGIGQTVFARTGGKVAQTIQFAAICTLTSGVLWVTGFLSSLFLAGAFCLVQLCAGTTRNELRYVFTGTAMILVSSAIMIAGLSLVADLNFEMVILIMCLASLVIALCSLTFRKQQDATTLPQPILSLTALNTADVWVAAMLLPTAQAMMYFSARLLTFLMPAFLHSFETLVAPALRRTYREVAATKFIHAMARVNLSLFLVAAAIAILVLTVHSHAIILWPEYNSSVVTAAYLLLAMFVPAALGQTGLATNLLVSSAAQNISHIVGFVGAAAFLAIKTPVLAPDVAISYLVLQTLVALVQSMHSIKTHGVWPGPTALFARQIRLLG
jgi:hypothetical protein